MAAATVGAESSIMGIIIAMARCARGSIGEHRTEILLMAGRAPQPCVRAGQRKLRNAAVIEHPCLPRDRAVTARADISQRAGVIIVRGVAIGAVFTGIVKCGSCMALPAIGLGMRADQRERPEPMVEPEIAVPRSFAVTVGAF